MSIDNVVLALGDPVPIHRVDLAMHEQALAPLYNFISDHTLTPERRANRLFFEGKILVPALKRLSDLIMAGIGLTGFDIVGYCVAVCSVI